MLFSYAMGCDSVVDETEPQVREERSYQKSIERIADNDFEASLIEKAEAIYPSRAGVIAAVPEGLDLEIPEEGYWFYAHFDGILIPYAVTNEAVAYYTGLFDGIEAGTFSQYIRKIKYTYSADVSFESEFVFDGGEHSDGSPEVTESFTNVYVVTMTLNWWHRCGDLCGMTLDAGRVVVFDESGNLLRVFLDGPAVPMVS